MFANPDVGNDQKNGSLIETHTAIKTLCIIYLTIININ
jgi:hypothetical protein